MDRNLALEFVRVTETPFDRLKVFERRLPKNDYFVMMTLT